MGSDQLWGGVTSVSAAGRKRGRTKSVKRRINLNIGQKIGYGNVFLCGKRKLQFRRKIIFFGGGGVRGFCDFFLLPYMLIISIKPKAAVPENCGEIKFDFFFLLVLAF